jgi:hypothetical protein
MNMFVPNWPLPRAVIEIKLNNTKKPNVQFSKLIFNC